MQRMLCIHGHFYQPPREDPWLESILPEGSAAPARNWNERICRESYAPLAYARRLDGAGKLLEIMNVYEWISFNYGPTLLAWLRSEESPLLARLQEADQASQKRLGHGNAIAQVYHHLIMPLASELDKEVELAWAWQDFESFFGREPEGLWFSEAAVDTPSLEAMAKQGYKFTILAPNQARAVRRLGDNLWNEVYPGNLDIRQPYRVNLESGRHIDIFFYDGPLSQSVAFERLLGDGENFFNRLSGAAGNGLLSLATDGETYGHHFKFGEMALAYTLDQARKGRDNLRLTNFAAYLEDNPPKMEVMLHAPSAWSCAHGVERWHSDCGCTTGGHPGWNQKWRAPLREAISFCKSKLDEHYFAKAASLFTNPRQCLIDFGKVLSTRIPANEFESIYFRPGLDSESRRTAWKLLAMQKWGLAAQASCAWFFDEISRLEPVNGLTYAMRAMQISVQTGARCVQDEFRAILSKAQSNIPEMGNGQDIFDNLIMPRLETPASLAGQAVLELWAKDSAPSPGQTGTVTWPGASISISEVRTEPGGFKAKAAIRMRHEPQAEPYDFVFSLPYGAGLFEAQVRIAGQKPYCLKDLAWNKRESIAEIFAQTRANEEFARQLRNGLAAIGLIPQLQEAQDTLNLAGEWAYLWAGLAFSYLKGAKLNAANEDLLLKFLRQIGQTNPLQANLSKRTNRCGLGYLSMDPPDLTALSGLIRRARLAGVAVDWWEVENRLWLAGLGESEPAKLLGFAVRGE